jgi:hypothetical protein
VAERIDAFTHDLDTLFECTGAHLCGDASRRT